MARWWMLSACLGALSWGGALAAAEPSTRPPTEAQRAYEAQRTRARELIHQRAAQAARERRERIAARRRAGISLSRPVHTGYPYQPASLGVAARQANRPYGFAIR